MGWRSRLSSFEKITFFVKAFLFLVKSKIIEKLFLPILNYSFLLPPLLFLLFIRKFTKELTALVLYGLTIFLFNFFFDELFIHFGDYYLFIYTLIEYATFAFILWHNIINKKFRLLIILLSILFLVFQIVYLLNTQKKLIDSIPIGFEMILVLIYIFYFFYEQLKFNTNVPLYKNYVFWIALGILIYLSGTFFFYILANHLPPKQIQPYWFITYIFDIVKNIFFAIGVLVIAYTPKTIITNINNVPNLDLIN
jgi:hypothetical protein